MHIILSRPSADTVRNKVKVVLNQIKRMDVEDDCREQFIDK